MKAIVQERYGSPDGLELREVAKPVAGDDEVLARGHRLHAGGLHATWCSLRSSMSREAREARHMIEDELQGKVIITT
jgi:hypothetical protein